MRKSIVFIQMLTMLFFISCSREITQEMKITESIDKVFYAEVPDSNVSKTYINTDLNIYWTVDDRLSVFRSTVNEKYRFSGATGQGKGTFEKDDKRIPGTAFDRNFAVYPYNATTICDNEGKFDVFLPSVQYYVENSFGLGTNTMVAATRDDDDDVFKFKNVCSYLHLKIYGGDRIRSIRFFGNNGEKIAGAGVITASYGVDPTIEMKETATTEITLDCGEEGVATGECEENCTTFWIVLPPTVFSKGFTVEATNTLGDTKIIRTNKPFTFTRNSIKPMEAFECDTQNQKELLSFNVSDGIHTYEAFDISDGYVNVQVPNETDMTDMKVSFTYNGAKVIVDGVEQTSGENSHDFSDFVNPVEYTVVSESELTQTYKIRMFNLPIIFVETPNHIPITSKTVWTENSTFIIRENDGTVTHDLMTSIRGRGNSTWTWYEKDPYAIKLNTKSELLGMPKHKRWCLLINEAGYYYSNMIGFELGRRTTSLEWNPRSTYVELFLNGSHKGLYQLVEQIKVDKNRVNITEMSSSDIDGEAVTGGYLFTYDNTFDEVNKFHSQYYNMPVMFKDPDEDVLVQVQFDYLKNYIDNFEASLKDDTRFASHEYFDYFDIDSYIDMWFVWEMAGDYYCYRENYSDFMTPRSVYFSKDRGELIKAGPVWDFNWCLFYRKKIICNKCQYYGRLFQDPYFVARVKEKWPEFKSRAKGKSGNFESIISYLDAIRNRIDASSKRDWDMWWKNGHPNFKFLETPDEQYTLIHNGIYDKLDYLESYINFLPVDYDQKPGGNEDFDSQIGDGSGWTEK